MIFNQYGSQLIEQREEGDYVYFTWGRDLTAHKEMCYQLREYDPRNGKSEEGHLQHIGAIDDITFGRLLVEQPWVLRDKKEMEKWFRTEEGKECRTSKDVLPIRGDGLQLIIK